MALPSFLLNERGVSPLSTVTGGHMVDKEIEEETAPAAPPAPRRGPGHRGADMRDTVAEMAERAQLISQEAGSKVSAAMKDVISAAAGLAGFAIESARDLTQYMVRRGQMTQEEADKLIREAEDSFQKKPASEKARPTASKIAADKAVVDKAAKEAAMAAAMLNAPPQQRPGSFSLRTGGPPRPPVNVVAPPPPAPKVAPAPAKAPAKPVAKAPAKPAAKAPAKAPAKAAPAKAAPAKAAAKPSKPAAKPAPKPAAKSKTPAKKR